MGAPLRAPRFAAAIALVALAMALVGPALAPYDPVSTDLSVRQRPPMFTSGGDAGHVLGTDPQGRDVLSRIVVGARTSVTISVLCLLIGGGLGTLLGIVAGYRRGLLASLIARSLDILMSFPSLLLALVLVVIAQASIWTVVGVLSLTIAPRFGRIVRGDVLAVRAREYVEAARSVGCSGPRIMARHIFPNVLSSILVIASLQVGGLMISEATLSFLGAGVPPPAPSWGGMIAEGRSYVDTYWWISAFPGAVLVLVVLSFNSIGDWLRDRYDPRLVAR
jgi:peptide/nickel transport system permease protein